MEVLMNFILTRAWQENDVQDGCVLWMIHSLSNNIWEEETTVHGQDAYT